MTSLNKKQKVSVIIPVYNVKEYLEEALDSVINQTYKNLEIILVDDGSDDGSEIICKEYSKKDSRIKLICRKNGGLSAARNTGLDNMTGDYVAFLDSDDVFLPEAIEKSVNIMLSNDVDCVIFKFIIYKVLKNHKLKKLYPIKNTVLLNNIYCREEALKMLANREINAAIWNKLSKRELWNNLRFPENHVYEDRYIIFKLIEKTKNIYILNSPLLFYKTHDGSISTTRTVKNTKDLLDSWSVFENYVETHTPEIFDSNQLEQTRKKIFIDLVLHYAKVLSMNFAQKEDILRLIKEYIKNREETINIKEYGFEIRCVYYFMSNDSKLISKIFPFIFRLYKFINSIANFL